MMSEANLGVRVIRMYSTKYISKFSLPNSCADLWETGVRADISSDHVVDGSVKSLDRFADLVLREEAVVGLAELDQHGEVEGDGTGVGLRRSLRPRGPRGAGHSRICV